MPRTKAYRIREATLDETFELTLLAKEAFEELPDKDHIKFHPRKVGNLIESSVVSDNFLTLVLEENGEPVGYFFAMIADYYFAMESQSVCLSWYIRPDYRSYKNALSLLKKYEEWAESKGVVSINMIDVKMSFSKAFERLGYTMAETTFIKRTS